jgi:hypothetical protein
MSRIEPPHGTEARYQRGCGCDRCRDANAAASRAKRDRRKLARAGMLDARPAWRPGGRRAAADQPRPGSPAAARRTRPRPVSEPAAGTGRASWDALAAVRAGIGTPMLRGPGERGQARLIGRPRPPSRQRPAQSRPAASAVPAPQTVVTLQPGSGYVVTGSGRGQPARAALPAGPGRVCDARRCGLPGVHELQVLGPPQPGQLDEGDPTWRCDRHRAELEARHPGGWHVTGSRPAWLRQREAEEAARQASVPRPGPPNTTRSQSRLPWDPAAAPPGGGLPGRRGQEPG